MPRLFTPPRSPFLALALLGFFYVSVQAYWWIFWRTHPSAKIDQVSPSLFLSVVLIAIGVMLAWQSANRDRGSGGSFVVKASCLAIVFAGGALIVNQWAQASRADPPTPTGPPLLKVIDNTAWLEGPIDFKSFAALENTLSAYPDLQVLVVNSPGGLIPAARGLARLIGEAKLDTHSETLCASACTLAFIAGQRRTLAASAQLGFHGYKLMSNVATLNIADEEARDRAFFIANGVLPTFAQRAFETPHADMWFPPHETLKNAGVLRP